MRQVLNESVKWGPAINKNILFFLLFIPGLAGSFMGLANTPSRRLVPHLKGHLGSPYGFWEYLPANYDSLSQHPVVIYLHGIKEIGSGSSEDELKKVLWGGPARLISKYEKDFPFILISPQSSGEDEGFAAQSVDKLIDIIVKYYKVDQNRIYVTGLSFGGYATWNIAAYSADKLAAVVPICSCVDSLNISKLKGLPMWAFVNGGDYEVPGCMFDIVNKIRHAGGNPLLTIYKKKGHNAWTDTYNNPAVWNWLLRQRRNSPGENQDPVFVNPGDQTLTIGYPASIPIWGTDRNNDKLEFIAESPLPPGVQFSVDDKTGQAVLKVNSSEAGSYPITITIKDGKGGSTTQRFILTTQYSPLLFLIVVLFFIQPMLMLIPRLRNQSLNLINLTTRTARLPKRVLVWLEAVAVRNNIL